MKTLSFTTTIHAPVSTVRNIMLNHPTYEKRTATFSEGSTYEGSRNQGEEMRFVDPSGQGMVATIAENRLHEYVSIHHLGEVMFDQDTNQLKTTLYDGGIFENYTFIALSDDETRVDIELTSLPEEYADMFNDMRPRALDALKDLCESV